MASFAGTVHENRIGDDLSIHILDILFVVVAIAGVHVDFLDFNGGLF